MKTSCFLLVAMLFLSTQRARAGDDGNNPEDEDRRKSLISLQILADFMYGTDDFFGEDRDIAYVDNVHPSPRTTPPEAYQDTARTVSDKTSSTGQKDGQGGTSPGTDTPGGGDSGKPPPIDERPEEPDPDPGGGCPT